MSSVKTRLHNGLLKTENNLASRIPLLGKFFRINEDLLETIEESLLAADVGVEFTEMLIGRLKDVRKKKVSNLATILKSEMKALLCDISVQKVFDGTPQVVLIVGVNGTGKTTTIGKLAWKFSKDGKKVLIVAADTFRAAAHDQLAIWAERAGVDFMGNPKGVDPAAVAFDGVKSAISNRFDTVFIDTAGRLHTKHNLMEELAKIKRVVGNVLPGAPHEILLVLDATTGQNGLLQAQEFMKIVEITGLILTKLDGTAKGGIVISIHNKLNIPIRYLGVGEKLEDLVEFDPEQFIEALFS